MLTNNKIYQVEVGVLLFEYEEEFEQYSNAFDKQYGYYDENIWFCDDIEEAKKTALNYVEKGVEKTYAIISEITINKNEYIIDASGNIRCKETRYEVSEEFVDFSPELVKCSYCKFDSKIKKNFVKNKRV